MSGWFENLTIQNLIVDETVLAGCVVDQAAVYGLISHLRDLGLELISVSSIEIDRESR